MTEEKKKTKEKAKKEPPKPQKTRAPEAEKTGKAGCQDRNCPTHGTLPTRGASFEGTVVSDKMRSTVVVMREYMERSRKYERYLLRQSRIPAHNPPCINAKAGDKVKIMECRRLSKTVSFVVVEKLSG